MLPFFYSVRPLFTQGFGYGDTTKPTFDEQAAQVGRDFVTAIENLVAAGHVLTPVGHLKNGELVHDDGCGDGRAVMSISEGTTVHRCSLSRPKVFGGGVMMATAMRIGLGDAGDEQLVEAFKQGMETLESAGVDYGAHTDSHATGDQAGCGAIDNALVVLANIKRYASDIRATLLGSGLGLDPSDVDAVLTNYVAYASGDHSQGYSGRKIVESIAERGKVVKRLCGQHHELFILLNDVAGMTANQSLIRDLTGGAAQLFDVDIWRLKEIAKALYGDQDVSRAIISELVYTLGVAATLTHGDLPVYLATLKDEFAAQPELVPAL